MVDFPHCELVSDLMEYETFFAQVYVIPSLNCLLLH